MGMEQVMRHFTERFFKKLLVEFLHLRVLVRFAHRLVHVFRINRFRTHFPDVPCGRNRLTASAKTSARTCHYFYKCIGRFSLLYLFKKFSRVFERMRNRYLDLVPSRSTSASLIPSMPRAGIKFISGSGLPVTTSYAVRNAASITPPVAPKITAAPVDSPSGLSNSSDGSAANRTPDSLNIRASSRVVRT